MRYELTDAAIAPWVTYVGPAAGKSPFAGGMGLF